MDTDMATGIEKQRVPLETDLKLAERVHRSMIPTNRRQGDLEIVCDFTPMIEVGGDYASVHFQDHRHVVVGICDVSGHGIAAALLASRVNSFVLNTAFSVDHPCGLAKALDAFVCRNFSQTGLYLTFFSLFIDLETQVLLYSGWGHPPVLLYSKRENEIIQLESENTVIGLIEDLPRPCTMTQIRFERGDRLVLYTDGITDGSNPDNTMLGVSGLAGYLRETAHLEPKECIAAIIRSIKDYRNGLPPDDDQLLLSISYMEESTWATPR